LNKRFFILVFFGLLLSACSLYRAPNYPLVDAGFPKAKEKDSLLGYLNEDRSCFDVTFYDLDLKIDPEKKKIEGAVDIHFDCLRDMSIMQVDLDKRLRIKRILDKKGQELSFKRIHRAVKVELNEEMKMGDEGKIVVEYEGKPKTALRPPWMGGLVWKKKKGKYFCGVACEDDGASIWWPCKDHISDKADSVQATYHIPKGYTCVANGRLIEQRDGDTYDSFTWRTSYPINNYNVSFYIGDYRHFTIPYSNPGSGLKQLDFYVRPEHLEVGKKHFQQSVNILKVYEEYFGPYPWSKDGYKLIDSPYEGMEHQTAIAYGDEFKNGKYLNYDYIILHETAHEWWGNYITVCDMADLWIHEGFATYAEMLYEEKTEGKDSYTVSYLINRISSKNKRAVLGPRDIHYTNFRDNDIYNKGAVVLHMLRRNMESDELFFRILYRFATEYHEQCVSTEDFMALVNEESGLDFDWFFEQYIFRRDPPELFFNYILNEKNESEFRYKWNPKKTNKNFKIAIQVTINDQLYRLYPSTQTQVLKLDAEGTGMVSVDKEDYMIITKKNAL
jgi:aminopeptidase N